MISVTYWHELEHSNCCRPQEDWIHPPPVVCLKGMGPPGMQSKFQGSEVAISSLPPVNTTPETLWQDSSRHHAFFPLNSQAVRKKQEFEINVFASHSTYTQPDWYLVSVSISYLIVWHEKGADSTVRSSLSCSIVVFSFILKMSFSLLPQMH